jgi:hypothetical protein
MLADLLRPVYFRASSPHPEDSHTNPRYVQMDPFGAGNDTAGGPTLAGGELYILTAHHPDGRVATVFASSVRRATDCVFQVQVMVTNSG